MRQIRRRSLGPTKREPKPASPLSREAADF